jgi:GNAT superfamily N-acetyltransferase
MAGSPAFAVRPATSADVKRLAAVLARAFYDDPPLVWMLPNPATRLARITVMFASVIGIESLHLGGVDVASDGEDIVGGAVWLPPGHWVPGFREQMRALPSLTWAVRSAPVRAFWFGRVLEDAHPGEPHWYLKTIGVDPARQGRGAAGLLLRSGLERCDRDRRPAYLEASTPGGVPIYERFGFRRTRDLVLPRGGPVLTAMWRPQGA